MQITLEGRAEPVPVEAGDTILASLLRAGEGGADTSVLRREGVLVVELITDPSRYFDVHHSPRDTLDTVHPRELELGAAALAAMAYGAAESLAGIPVAGKR